MSMISKAVSRMQPSATMAISQLALEKKAKGENVIAMSAGEPDFDTPEHIKHAAKKALNEGKTKYTAVDGISELKAAIAAKFARDNGIEVAPAQCFVATGGKQILFNALVASVERGDEVIIPAPYWVSYPEMVRFASGVPIFIPTSKAGGFKITPEQLENAISARTKWLILNSPSNPTGAVYRAGELAQLAHVLRQYPHVHVIVDDIYEHLDYSGHFVSLLQAAPDLCERVVTMNGVSKAYAMTGWRIGYCTGPDWLLGAMRKLQGQATSNPCSVAQWAAVAALEGDQRFLTGWRQKFQARRDVLINRLNAIAGLHCQTPDGAFYAFVECGALLGKTSAGGRLLTTDADIALALLDEQNVACVPGSAFGLAGHMRFSYAMGEQQIEQAMDRVNSFVDEL